MNFTDASFEQINLALNEAWEAFHQYKLLPLSKRAEFMRAIADEIMALGDPLVHIAAKETHLTKERLVSELNRTIFQLKNYGAAAEEGSWLELRIDEGDNSPRPIKPDLRKMQIPLGPVVVFGAANFPFAYSTAGGDTACAFAAGCPVIVKAHPHHAETSSLVADAIDSAIKKCNLHPGLFHHIHGASTEVGQALVQHRYTKAVGFTGSFAGGKALFDLANQRPDPIPVFAEMSSINPVFILPEKLQNSTEEIASMYAASITVGVGQFCTNPGLIIGIENEAMQQLIRLLSDKMKSVDPAAMLNSGIAKNFSERLEQALQQEEVLTISENIAMQGEKAIPVLASATGQAYLTNPLLHHEVFGPYSLVIRCRDMNEMRDVINHTEGQLTSTILATENDLAKHWDVVESVKNICGRLIYNGVPTGVEVCQSMHHGGPFPATTDSRFTSVGSDGIKRFARPICYQNWPDHLLPDPLKNGNPLNMWRTVNGKLTKEAIR
jgi:2,5-dioxopentanoate dehydrogenase